MAVGDGIVTVFGGSGFIGRHVVQRLARRESGHVRVACRHPGRAGFLMQAGDAGRVIPIAADIADPDSVARAVAGADEVINLVGILFESHGRTFQALQAEGAGTVASAAAAAGASRLVHVSAIGADTGSRAGYARTKADGEAAVRAAFPRATILRPSIVFGPEDDFFNRFAAMARLAPALPLIGGGHTRFQPVYVGDVADAVMAALADAGACGRLYELGGPSVYSFRRLLEITLKEIGRHRLLLPLPWSVAMLQASLFELLPVPPLTRDQVEMLKSDNVVAAGAPGLRDLGVTPTALEVILPSYLGRFRRGGPLARGG